MKKLLALILAAMLALCAAALAEEAGYEETVVSIPTEAYEIPAN